MDFKKRVNGSWADTPNYIYNTSTDTITTLPANIYPTDTTATVGLGGNMEQSGTPSPTTPIQPQETGEKTGNLYPLDASKLHVGRIENDGTIDYESGTLTVGPDSVTYEANEAWRGFYTDFIQVNETEKLTFSLTNNATAVVSCSCYDENDNFLGKATSQSTASTRIFTLLTGTKKVRVSVTSSDTTYTILRPMLNTGSTALPYEPYGYKIPISSAGQTTPIYLGEVETTRRIKKLVLTGEENWNEDTSNYYIFLNVSGKGNGIPNSTALSTHTESGVVVNSNGTALFFKKSVFVHSSLADFKAYLQQQYAAGTPVTVWYVLAEPTTGIVNEPLRKIGDYADTVSGITIPTIAGANTIDVDTTLKPSEVSVNYHGWHPVSALHRFNGTSWN